MRELSKTEQPTSPTLILHVGEGLVQYLVPNHHLSTWEALSQMMQQHLVGNTKAEQGLFFKSVLPEYIRTEKTAILAVMQQYREILDKPNGVLNVVTLNANVASGIINAMMDTGNQLELLVCLHDSDFEEGYKLSWLDHEGFLQEWPYGVLNAHVDVEDLRAMKFPIRHPD